MSVNIIYPGSTVRIRGIFRDLVGLTLNPNIIVLKIQTPSGTITQHTEIEMETSGVGIWDMHYIPQTPGRYTIQWLTDTPDVVGQSYFDVKPLAF